MDIELLKRKTLRALFVESVALTDLLNLNRLADGRTRKLIQPMIFDTYLHAAIMRGIVEAADKTEQAMREEGGKASAERLAELLEAQDQDEAEALAFYEQASQELESNFLRGLFSTIAEDEKTHHKILLNAKSGRKLDQDLRGFNPTARYAKSQQNRENRIVR
ncbi:MAG: ferritin family protein [TACK group archaeon]|nr:ferritin family protein [TACK group archaeon]